MEDKEKQMAFFDEEDADISELLKSKQMELVGERVRKAKLDNDIREGVFVHEDELKQEVIAIINPIYIAYNEMVEMEPDPVIKEKLIQFYNSWILKSIEKIEAYIKQRDRGNE